MRTPSCHFVAIPAIRDYGPIETFLACLAISLLAGACQTVLADGPIDNQDAQVRRIPPIGIELSSETKAELLQIANEIDGWIPAAPDWPNYYKQSEKPDWWNDIRVITRAVKMTIEGQQFYKDQEIEQAKKLLALAKEHASELRSAEAQEPGYVPTWSKQAGRMIAGHRSRLDDSVQPLGIIVPECAIADPQKPRRLDIWLHGRDESVCEVAFLYRRWTQDSQYLPEDTFVLQPWGRYSNAFRFAGEVDVSEALTEVQRRYAIDPDRISIRGFSMGGAGCWHLATHHPDRFFAANPGAGFCETERFLTGFQSEVLNPSPAQRRMWNLYDCPPVVRNLFNLPTVAYSGGIDRQKEAADIMTEAAKNADFIIPYVIHPESAHVIHPDSKREIEQRISEHAKQGRTTFPKTVIWSTYSLRYPGAYWIRLTELDQHWNKATIDARFSNDFNSLTIKTENVRSFQIDIPVGSFTEELLPTSLGKYFDIKIDGKKTNAIMSFMDGSLTAIFQRDANVWRCVAAKDVFPPLSLRKRPGLQGPIDDAFLERFLIVRPTGSSKNAAIDAWIERELRHAIEHWRSQFRGDARVKSDVEVSAEDLKESNVICFGTPESNRLIAKMISSMPIRWTTTELVLGSQSYEASKVVPVLIYPNPLFPDRYVVFNSGFTYREYDYLNNARQTPKLPDWAMLDSESPQTTRAPGRVVAEGFFNEQWRPEGF